MSGNNVNHPEYYQLGNGLEAIDVIESKISEMKGMDAYVTGKILEHILRWDKKDCNNGGKKDFEEISWWSQYMIDHINKEIKEEVDDFTKKITGGGQNG